MSRSLIATYNSDPRGYCLRITSINKANGALTGNMSSQTEGDKGENFNGEFHFDKTQKQTRINFSTSTDKWELWAEFNRDGGVEFETFKSTRTSLSDANNNKFIWFYMDLSGKDHTSWFGTPPGPGQPAM